MAWTIVGGSTVVNHSGSNWSTYTVPETSDDEVAGTIRYVAKWGNDANGNGSRNQPYATIQAVVDGPSYIAIVESGDRKSVV